MAPALLKNVATLGFPVCAVVGPVEVRVACDPATDAAGVQAVVYCLFT